MRGYGEQNANDLWGIIQQTENTAKYSLDKWFVPSRAEWLAFGDMLYTKFEANTDNYGEFGLSDYYWSSSQEFSLRAWRARFSNGYMNNSDVDNKYCVRLSATF